ncbi:MAG TPA: FHA domain-containing protein [Aggregatilineales bacterium]|nr:FHA domain-containing protein [Aggregatilineales bacterium]
MPTTCPACNNADNSETAMYCIQCGYPLRSQDRPVTRKRVTSLLPPDKATPEFHFRNQSDKELHRPEIALYIGDSEEPTIIPLTRDLILGRSGSTDLEPVGVDLTPNGAVESGVSRRHAMLRRLDPDIVLLDLDSTNGTWLNGVQVKGNQPVTLRSGDRLILGRLMIQVFLPN